MTEIKLKTLRKKLLRVNAVLIKNGNWNFPNFLEIFLFNVIELRQISWHRTHLRFIKFVEDCGAFGVFFKINHGDIQNFSILFSNHIDDELVSLIVGLVNGDGFLIVFDIKVVEFLLRCH